MTDFARHFIALALLLATVAQPAVAAEPVDDPKDWANDAMALLTTGTVKAFQARFMENLGSDMEAEVTAAIAPFAIALGGRKAVYVDLLEQERLGKSFERFTYAVYLGARDFLFVRLTFAKLDIGFSPITFEFDDDVSGIIDGLVAR
ncbi:MAG: hypothetical protein QNJ92_10470 [Alphaproteobacteria bacterium]|nr:hypothetical protein [Alphaproteobacteria bacterium]